MVATKGKTLRIQKRYILLVGPLILFLLSLLFVFPQILIAPSPLTEIPSSGLFPDMQLGIVLEPLVARAN